MSRIRAMSPRAFVIMPFDVGFQSVYDKLIVPALEGVGYDVKRADSDLDQQNVLKDVVRGIAQADLVVAELTSRNPNVLYELGLCHALRKNAVLITQSIDDIPFDLRSYRVIRYSTQFDTADVLSTQLAEIAKANSDGGIEFGSPIIDFLPDSITTSPSRPREEDQTDAPDSPPKEEEKEGYLDAILSIGQAGEGMKYHLGEIGQSTVRIGEEFEKSNSEIEAVQQAGGDTMFVKAHGIAGEMGKALDRYAEELASEAPPLEDAIRKLVSSGLSLTSWLAAQEDIDIEQAIETRDSIAGLGASASEGLTAIRGFRKILVELSGISRDMARGTGRAISSLDGIAGSLEQVEAFAQKAIDLLEEWIQESPEPPDTPPEAEEDPEA